MYGPIVRTGATHISIADSAFVEPVLGHNATPRKGAWYDIDYPYHSLHEERDPKVHEKKRGLWAPAFSDKALRGYNVQLNLVNEKFMEKVHQLEGTPIDVTKWISIYMFDVMQAVVFGRHEYLLDTGEKPPVFETMANGMAILGLVLPPWFIRILKLIPGNPLADFHEFTDRELERAVRNEFQAEKHVGTTTGNSIVHWLYKIYQREADPATNPLFRVDARLLIMAGSETTAAALTFLFYLLAKHPHHVLELRRELQGKQIGADSSLIKCEHLNAFIKESLRLYPPGPSGVFRLTPPEGLRVGATQIPGSTNIQLPVYSIHRDERAFVQPGEFIPERWYSKPELIKDATAWAPFVKGPYQCIGKPLAMMQIRTLAAKVISAYDMHLAPGEDGSSLLYDSKDHFSMTLAPLHLVFTRIEPTTT